MEYMTYTQSLHGVFAVCFISFKYLRSSVGEYNKTSASHVLGKARDEDEFSFLTVKFKDVTLCQTILMLFIIKAQNGGLIWQVVFLH